MDRFISVCVLLLVLCSLGGCFFLVGSVVASPTLWSRTYGGTEDDVVSSMVATSDGGYIITGYTESFGAGETDVWLVKTDENGNLLWNRTYGGPNSDYGESVQQTEDGGYIVAGYTGWLEELPYDKSDPFYIIPANRPHEFHFDAYLVKTDEDGNLMWNRTYSSEGDDYGRSVEQTSDGGYVITGYTRAFGITGVDYDDYDVWLFKTDENGEVEWSRTYGGEKNDRGESVKQTSDGGYVIGGYTNDFLLIKTDPDGYMTWNKTYDIGREDTAFSVIQTSDEGYLVAGTTRSFPERVHDGWVVKTDPDGDMQWNRTYGGSERDSFRSVQQTLDGGYIMAGHTSSFDLGFLGGAWLVKTDGYGNMLWNHTYSEDGGGAESVIETSGGAYVVAGSSPTGDFWLFKVDYSAPQITVLSPVNGSHTVADVDLNFTLSEPVTWRGYSLDGQENVTIAGNTTISGLSDGDHTLMVYAEDYAGNTAVSDPLYFTVDTVVPSVSIISPKNQTYQTHNIPLNFTLDETPSRIGYSLDGETNITIQGNTTLSDLPAGHHSLTMYTTDTAGNTGTSETVYFTIVIPTPIAAWAAVAVGITAVVGGAVWWVYRKKI